MDDDGICQTGELSLELEGYGDGDLMKEHMAPLIQALSNSSNYAVLATIPLPSTPPLLARHGG